MRARYAIPMALALISVGSARPAAAQYAPEPPPAPYTGDRFWETARPEPGNPAKAPLLITGAIAGGLGFIAIGVSGITASVAAGHAARLDHTCQGRYCVRGTAGGDNYEAVGELLDVSGVLLGVGVPLLTSGLTFTIIGASLRGDDDVPRIAVSPGRVTLEVTF